MKRITSKGSGTLGFTFFSGLAISLWSANAGVKAVFDALNVAYDEEEKRGFIALNLRSLAFTLGMIVFALVAIGAIVVVPVLLNFIGLGRSPNGSSPLPDGRSCWERSCSCWLFSTATGRAETPPNGAGSVRAASWRRWSGWPLPCCSRGTWRTSAPTGRGSAWSAVQVKRVLEQGGRLHQRPPSASLRPSLKAGVPHSRASAKELQGFIPGC